MKTGRLRWLMVVLPGALVWVFETIRHSLLDGDVPTWLGNIAATAVVLCVSFFFAHFTFRIISRAHTKLAAQNQELRRLNAQVREIAILEERSRLAREMHDGLAQTLAFVMLKTETVTDLLARHNDTAAAHELAAIRRVCDDTYGDVREAIVALRVDLSDSARFVSVLRETLERAGDAAGLHTQFRVEGATDVEVGALVSPAAAVQLVRVAQEGLANIRKHAQARTASLTLHIVPPSAPAADSGSASATPELMMELRDDGIGFDSTAARTGPQHLGLAIMRERVESLGGRFVIESAAGRGTVLRAVVPGVAQLVAVGR